VEAKLAAREANPSLRYFADRLELNHAVQIAREPEGFKNVFTSAGVILALAAHFLSLI
jgi:hypothetical protein